MQSDSTHDPGTTPDTRSLTDLWRDIRTGYDTWARVDSAASLATLNATRDQFWKRISSVGDHYRAAEELAEGQAR